ncbi:Myb-DNA-bind-2 domain-containing protein [Mycena kentingensis (nom. inval.)]|nr:Myb-DNA-bind-2 domain-containing protein [Mycena kentingensis (nom. inval.)]
MRLPPRSLLGPALVLPLLVCAAPKNTTFDDTSASFSFSTGPQGWNAVTPSSPCDVCASNPDTSRVHEGTWHDGNIRSGAEPTTGSFTFTGSAVYIFGIDQTWYQSNIEFRLGSVRTTHHYTGQEQFAYDALFFSATGLASGTYTVTWELKVNTVGENLPPVQAALFDYAIVTTEEETSAPGGGSGGGQDTGDDGSGAGSQTKSITRLSSTVISANHGDRKSTATSGTSNPASSSAPDPTSMPASTPLSGSTLPLSQTVTINGVTTVIVTGGSTISESPSNVATAAVAPSKFNVSIIIGVVVGAIFALLATYFVLCRRRRKILRETAAGAVSSRFLRIGNYPLQAARSPADASQTLVAAGQRSREKLNDLTTKTPSTALPVHLPPEPSSVEATLGSSASELGTGTTRNLEEFEARIAMLEAHIAVNQEQQQQPPPYLH